MGRSEASVHSIFIQQIHGIRKPGSCQAGRHDQKDSERRVSGLRAPTPGQNRPGGVPAPAGLSPVRRWRGRPGEAPLLAGTHHLVSLLQRDNQKFSLAWETRCQRSQGGKAAPHAREGQVRPRRRLRALHPRRGRKVLLVCRERVLRPPPRSAPSGLLAWSSAPAPL